MEAGEWDDLDDDSPDLVCDPCIEAVLRDAPANCFYCRLGELDLGDDD